MHKPRSRRPALKSERALVHLCLFISPSEGSRLLSGYHKSCLNQLKLSLNYHVHPFRLGWSSVLMANPVEPVHPQLLFGIGSLLWMRGSRRDGKLLRRQRRRQLEQQQLRNRILHHLRTLVLQTPTNWALQLGHSSTRLPRTTLLALLLPNAPTCYPSSIHFLYYTLAPIARPISVKISPNTNQTLAGEKG